MGLDKARKDSIAAALCLYVEGDSTGEESKSNRREAASNFFDNWLTLSANGEDSSNSAEGGVKIGVA